MYLTIAILIFLVIASKHISGSGGVVPGRIVELYGSFVRSASLRFGIPERRIYAIIEQESSGKADSLGGSGERGLMQMKQDALTDANSHFLLHYTFDDLWEPEKAIIAGTAYLAVLRRWTDGDLDLATRAYNVGIGNVLANSASGGTYLASVLTKENHYT